jgi:hypothetical protein
MAVTAQGRPKPKTGNRLLAGADSSHSRNCEGLTITTDRDEDFFEISFPIRVHATPKDTVSVAPVRRSPAKVTGKTQRAILRDIAYARSGDKGDTCNIGVIARTPDAYDWLAANLTTETVKAFFKDITFGRVVRFELDNIQALNFLLEQTLDGGGTRSLMIDPQGKTLAQALLQMPVTAPVSLLTRKAGKK